MRTAFEIVKAHYDANDRGDPAGMLADIGPTTRWTEMAGFPCAGTYIGPDQVVEHVFKFLGAEFEKYSFKLDRLLDAGEDVVAVGDYSATHRATGKAMNARVVHVWRCSENKIASFEQFTDTLLVANSMRNEVPK